MALRSATLYLANDSHIREDNPNTNYGALTTFEVGEKFIVSWVEHRGILRVDWLDIPRLGEIQTAELHIPIDTAPGNPLTLKAYAVSHQAQFTELGITWNTYNGSVLWNTAGILEAGQVAVAETVIDPLDAEAVLDISMALYDWHKGRVEDQGLLLVGETPQEWAGFYSRTESPAPYVEVTYQHHETVLQAGRERWWATVVDPQANTIYDDYLEVAPEEINMTQELPTEDVILTSRSNMFITPFKGTDADSYAAPFDTNQIDDFLFERSGISRQIELGWGPVTQSYADLWWKWMEFGCTIYLYPGRRYDPIRLRKAVLGLEGENVWTEWPWIDPSQNFRLWENGIEVYNTDFGSWTQENNGGRVSEGERESPEDEYEYLSRFRWKVRPIDVTPAYHATHYDVGCQERRISSLQVTCLEEDVANLQFGT